MWRPILTIRHLAGSYTSPMIVSALKNSYHLRFIMDGMVAGPIARFTAADWGRGETCAILRASTGSGSKF
jgi:hypothetical protein